MEIVSFKLDELYNELKHDYKMDKYYAGGAVLLIFPAFMLEGKGSSEAIEYSQLQGLFQALQSNYIEKECQ